MEIIPKAAVQDHSVDLKEAAYLVASASFLFNDTEDPLEYNPYYGINITDGERVYYQNDLGVQCCDNLPSEVVPIGGIYIPPGKSAWAIETECSYSEIPDEGITIFGYGLHMHSLGKQIWTTLKRNNTMDIMELDGVDIGCNTEYDFDLQELLAFADAE